MQVPKEAYYFRPVPHDRRRDASRYWKPTIDLRAEAYATCPIDRGFRRRWARTWWSRLRAGETEGMSENFTATWEHARHIRPPSTWIFTDTRPERKVQWFASSNAADAGCTCYVLYFRLYEREPLASETHEITDVIVFWSVSCHCFLQSLTPC